MTKHIYLDRPRQRQFPDCQFPDWKRPAGRLVPALCNNDGLNRILVLPVVLLPWLAAVDSAGAQRPPDTYTVHFRDQIGLSRDLRLAGETDSAVITFFCESVSVPAEGSTLGLVMEHSREIDDARSFLTLHLNYGTLRSMRLDSSNSGRTEVRIPIPASVLKPRRNRLEISVRQYPRPGSGPSDLWTAIGADSRFTIRAAVSTDPALIDDLPAPFVDPFSYRPQGFDVLQPKGISTASLEATALVVANLSRQAAPAPVEVRVVERLEAVRRPVVVIGTAEEQPDLDRLPPPGSNSVRILSPDEGMVALTATPSPAAWPVLAVAGPTPHAVRDAARAFPPSRLGGTREGKEQTPVPREWPGYIPPRSRFSLADLGFEQSGLGAANDFSLSIPLRAPPDFRFDAYPVHIMLALRMAPGARQSQGRLQVRLNESLLGEWAAGDLSGATPDVKIRFPGRLLQPDNLLRISLSNPPEWPSQKPLMTVLPSTRFYLPHEYGIELPDLATLRHGFFPFSTYPDLSSTILLVPSRITSETFDLVVRASAAIGRLAPGDPLRFRVKKPEELTAADRSSSYFVYLREDGEDEDPAGIFPGLPAPEPSVTRRLQIALSPWNRDRVVLVLDRTGADVLSAEWLAGLTGDTILLGEGKRESLQLSPRRTLRETFPLRRIEAWISSSWYALPLVVTLVSGLLYVAYLLRFGKRLRKPQMRS